MTKYQITYFIHLNISPVNNLKIYILSPSQGDIRKKSKLTYIILVFSCFDLWNHPNWFQGILSDHLFTCWATNDPFPKKLRILGGGYPNPTNYDVLVSNLKLLLASVEITP